MEIVVTRARGSRRTQKPGFARGDSGGELTELRREVYWPSEKRRIDTPVRRIEGQAPSGHTWEGPTIVEMPHTTLVVHPGQTAATDDLGNIVLTFGKESR